MITENLSTLKIHRLTQAQYDREFEAGNIDPNALYLTPEKEPIFIQNDEPTDAEDGTLWLDLDAVGQSSGGGSVFYDGEMVYSQNHEPIGAPDGTLWVDLDDNEGFSGSGGSGLPSGGTVGQVLTIGEDGNPVWADPTGGETLPAAEEVLFG